jgi:hypothetical protein
MASDIAKSVLKRQPQTVNTLQFNQFRFVLHRTPETVYFCQGVKFPGISMEPFVQPTPHAMPVYITPNKLNFENLEFTFLVAEDFKNWLEIYNWMHKLMPVKHFSNQYKEHSTHNSFDTPETRYQDGTLILLNSASKGFLEINFQRLFPISLGGIDFSSTVSDANPVTCTVQFAYTGYTINSI